MPTRVLVLARLVLAAALAAGGVSLVGTALLAVTRLGLPGKEVALGAMVAFWFGAWLVIEPVFAAAAYWFLHRRAVPERLTGRQLHATLWWAGLLLLQYLGFKWGWGNDGYTELARRAFLPVHLAIAAAVLVVQRWQRGPGTLAAVWLVLQGLCDAATSRSSSPIAGWFGLALGAALLVATLTRESGQTVPV